MSVIRKRLWHGQLALHVFDVRIRDLLLMFYFTAKKANGALYLFVYFVGFLYVIALHYRIALSSHDSCLTGRVYVSLQRAFTFWCASLSWFTAGPVVTHILHSFVVYSLSTTSLWRVFIEPFLNFSVGGLFFCGRIPGNGREGLGRGTKLSTVYVCLVNSSFRRLRKIDITNKEWPIHISW